MPTPPLTNDNTEWLSDIFAQIVFSKDGRSCMLVFNRTSLGLSGAIGNIGIQNGHGVSLDYSKKFNYLLSAKNKKDFTTQKSSEKTFVQ